MLLDPALKLRPGLSSDVPGMVRIFLDAFSCNAVGRTFFPQNSPSAIKFWTGALTEEMHDAHAHFLVVTDASDTPIAFAKWIAPLPSGTCPPPPPAAESDWPADGDPKLAVTFFKKLADTHESVMAGRPHWYLEMMVTRTRDQGRGAGGMMMRWGVGRADEERVACYLDATPEGKPLYERFGFGDAVETWSFFDERYRHSFMMRKPVGEGDAGYDVETT